LHGSSLISTALGVATGMADVTPLLIDQHSAAIRALPGHVYITIFLFIFKITHSQEFALQVMVYLRGFDVVVTALDSPFQYNPDCIGAGEHRMALLPGDRGTANALEMLYN